MKRLIALVAIAFGLFAIGGCDLVKQAQDALADAGINIDDAGNIHLPDGGVIDWHDGGGNVPDAGETNKDAGDVTPDAGQTEDDAGGEVPDAGQSGDCNALMLIGPEVHATHTADVAPTPTGGTITDGYYNLTARTYYDGQSGTDSEAVQMTILIVNHTIQVGMLDPVEMHFDGTFTTGANGAMTVNVTCAPEGFSGPIPVDHFSFSSGNVLHLFGTTRSLREDVLHYAGQPPHGGG